MEKAKPSFIIALGKASKAPPLKGEEDTDYGDMGRDEDEESEHMDMARSAMADLIQAIQKKDLDAALDAWYDLCELHEQHEMSESPEEEASEHKEY